MSQKIISQFRSEIFGLFIDLTHGGTIGVSLRDGDILLDEGEGPDCYHGAVISADDFRGFALEGTAAPYSLALRFGTSDTHSLGLVGDMAAARRWVQQAEKIILAKQKHPAEEVFAEKKYRPGTPTKLYVGNLSYNTTETDLQDLFATVGHVLEAIIMQDRMTAKSRGFGFVTMAEADDAQKAIELFHGKQVNGRELTVNGARPRDERAGGSGGFGSGTSSKGYGTGYRH